MVLTWEQIQTYIKKPKNKEIIDRSIEIHREHIRHVYGVGIDKFLVKIEGFESDAQEKIRLKYVGKPTMPIYGRALMNMEKIFSATGGTTFYKLNVEKQEERLTELLESVGDGMSLKMWMQSIWKDKVNTDPGGLNFIELDGDGTPYLTYKSIMDIHDYDFTGIQCEYVIFNPITTSRTDSSGKVIEGRYYRVVDDENDYYVLEENDTLKIVDDETYKNYFGRTPGILFSNQIDPVIYAKTTYIYKSITIADDFLVDASIHKLYKKKHGYPVFAMRGVQCHNCGGDGYLRAEDNEQVQCSVCMGSGTTIKKDISDIVEIPPLEQDQPDPMNPVATYVHAPTEISKEQREILAELEIGIYNAIWGENTTDKNSNQTATGELIDISHTIDKLEDISTNAEIVEMNIADLFGSYYFPESFEGSIINYGRKYVLKKDNQLWKEYQEARRDGAPEVELNMKYEEYLRSKYQKDRDSLNWALKLMSVEPNLHKTLQEMKSIDTDRIEMLKKQYFNEFIDYIEMEKPGGVRRMKVVELKTELDKYIKERFNVEPKIKQNETS